MKVQTDNLIMSSFLQFVDNKVCTKGEAFTNHQGNFYPVQNLYNGYYTYAAPFKQMVSDVSVPGATVMNQVYVNGSVVSVGNGDFVGVNHYEGQVYFSSDQGANAISGNYAVKDFNVYLTNDPEENILFEEKYHINPRTTQVISGLAPNEQTYPAIYIKNNGGKQVPFAFGGVDNNKLEIRTVVLSDSSFKLDAVCGILKDSINKYVPIIDDLPYNAMNAYTGTNYNYTGLSATATGQNPLIWDVHVSKNVTRGQGLNPGIYTAFVDFELHYLMF